jgi:hypothetical protein
MALSTVKLIEGHSCSALGYLLAWLAVKHIEAAAL